MNKIFSEGIRTRKLSKITCPHCQSKAIVKYGIYKKEQRYKCKECGRTFNSNTGTLLNWSHYKEKWGCFIETMGKDMSLREAGQALGISYSALFYWRHKIMNILNQKSDERLNGVIEMAKLNMLYLDKYHEKKTEDEDFEGGEPEKRDMIHLTFLYQRNNRLNSYVYSDKTRTMDFICGISHEIDKKSRVCLNVNFPFRLPLLYNKFKIMDIQKSRYNAKTAVKLLAGFITWMKKFRGVSSRNLNKYAAFYKTHKVFNTMEYLILACLSKNLEITNSSALQGDILI